MDYKTEITKSKYIKLAVSTYLIFIVSWSILSLFTTDLFLPGPVKIVESVWDLFVNKEVIYDIGISFYRVMTGFFAAAVIALPVGVLMGSFVEMEALLEPFNDLVRYMPVPAFIPLIILWVGVGDISQMLVIFIGTFFQLIILIADDVSSTPNSIIETAKTLGISKRGILYRIIIPYSSPMIYDDMRVAVGWAWSYLVIAEIIGANRGIGHVIMQAQRYLNTDIVIAGIVIIGLIGLTIDYFFKYIYKKLFPWTEK